MTALDLISSALRLVGVLGEDDTASDSQADNALTTLNQMVDDWGDKLLTILTIARTAYGLTSGTVSYTIGSGGTFNQARPVFLDHAGLILDTAAATPTEVPIDVFSDQAWELIRQKTLQSSQPTGIFYDRNWVAGLGRIWPWPIPNTSNKQVVLYTPTAITEFANLSTDYTFAPGYKKALRYNLALELADEYGRTIGGGVVKGAVESFAGLQRTNLRIKRLSVDPALTGRGHWFDYRTGEAR